MTVSELARRAGVTADTVRHYTHRGLLVPRRDERNGYNFYGSDDLTRLLFIRKARLLGFSLGDVGDILKDSSHGHSPCPRVRKLMEQHLQESRRKLLDLKKLQTRMERATALWATMPDGMPDGNAVCHLIEAMAMKD
ncbi:MAG: MerR family transcriptional regulator [Acidithiobacillus ferrivorans]